MGMVFSSFTKSIFRCWTVSVPSVACDMHCCAAVDTRGFTKDQLVYTESLHSSIIRTDQTHILQSH